SRPELAWVTAMRLSASGDEEALAAYREAASAVEKLESPPPLVMSAAIQSLATYENNGEPIPAENREAANRIRAKLPGWYRRANPKSSQAQYAFISIAAQLSRD